MNSVASLLFDSLTSKRLGGLRGYMSTMRQMLFTTGDFDIDVQISSSGGLVSLAGQVLARNHRPASGDVGLLQVVSEVKTVALSKFGEFQFEKLTPGQYGLQIRANSDTITIASFEIMA